MKNSKKLKELLITVAEEKRYNISKELFDWMLKGLEKYDINDIEQALLELSCEKSFFPRLDEIQEKIRDIKYRNKSIETRPDKSVVKYTKLISQCSSEETAERWIGEIEKKLKLNN